MSQQNGKGSRPISEQLKGVAAKLVAEEQVPSNAVAVEEEVEVEEDESEEDISFEGNVEIEVEVEVEEDSDAESSVDEDGDDEADAVVDDSVFATTPFAGLVSQSINIIVGLGKATDAHDFNFQNPFSKKSGAVREFIAGILPMMQDLDSKNVLLLTDNFRESINAVMGVLSNNSVKQIESMFGGENTKSLGFPVTMSVRDAISVDSEYPSLSIDTTVQVNMPALTDVKNDLVIKNLFIYLDKLREELGNIKLRVIFGFVTEDLINTDTRSAFDDFKSRADANADGSLKLIVKSNNEVLNDYGFDEGQIYGLFEDFDVVFVKA